MNKFFLILLFFICLVSCDNDIDNEFVSYKIMIIPETGVKYIIGAGYYREGEDVTLKAISDDGYTFTGWYENGNKVSDNLAYSFIAEQERTLEARFTLNKYIISATSQAGGSVSGDGTYNYGQNVTLRATPQTGYAFAGWYEKDSLVCVADFYAFVVSKDRNISAKFYMGDVYTACIDGKMFISTPDEILTYEFLGDDGSTRWSVWKYEKVEIISTEISQTNGRFKYKKLTFRLAGDNGYIELRANDYGGGHD